MSPSVLLATCFHADLLLDLFLTLMMEGACSSETSDDFNGLHGVTCQQLELFITTSVRISSPTFEQFIVYISSTTRMIPTETLV
jgi:hypothetical protein